MHSCKLNLPAGSAGGTVAAQAQIQSQSLTVHREDKRSEGRAVNMKGDVCMGKVFLNTVVADTCPHPKADLSDVRDHRSVSQVANQTAVRRVTTLEKTASLRLHKMKLSLVLLAYSKKHIHAYCQS